MELLKIWEEWARKNGYTSLTQDGIIKTMVTEFCKHLESIPMQLPVKPACETDKTQCKFCTRETTKEDFDYGKDKVCESCLDKAIANELRNMKQ